MSTCMEKFKASLEEFARKHKKEINRNPDFRRDFYAMCLEVGVDPLASNKGFWGELLGLGDFYYELAVQIVDVCLATRASNGGIMPLADLQQHILRLRGRNAMVGSYSEPISMDDLERAIGKLSVLGGGYRVFDAGGRKMVQSVPVELNKDHIDVFALAEARIKTGFVSVAGVQEALHWPEMRIQSVLRLLQQEGMVWIDTQAGPAPLYWFPTFVPGLFDAP